MKTYIVELNEEHIKCLDEVTEILLRKAKAKNAGIYSEFGANLEEVRFALDSRKQITHKDSAKERITRIKYDLCKEHPFYGAERVPQTDCEGHWAAYKKAHPSEYIKAKRDYDRKRQLKND